MLIHSTNDDIHLIAGVPSWVYLILNIIIQEYKLENIHDIGSQSSYMEALIYLLTKEISKQFQVKQINFTKTIMPLKGVFDHNQKIIQTICFLCWMEFIMSS